MPFGRPTPSRPIGLLAILRAYLLFSVRLRKEKEGKAKAEFEIIIIHTKKLKLFFFVLDRVANPGLIKLKLKKLISMKFGIRNSMENDTHKVLNSKLRYHIVITICPSGSQPPAGISPARGLATLRVYLVFQLLFISNVNIVCLTVALA
jgi:hypothetical protein